MAILKSCSGASDAVMLLNDWYQSIDNALAQGDMMAAARTARLALDSGHRNAYLLNMAAWLCEQAGDIAGARALLEEARQLDPADPLVRISLGALLRQEGRYDEAIAAFDSISPQPADNPAFWLERAYALDFSGLTQAAQADYQRSAALDPSAPALAGLASALVRLGKVDEAQAVAFQALTYDPANATAHLALARIELEAGKFADAQDRLNALFAQPGLAQADRLPTLALLGNVEDRLDRPDEAFDVYTRANQVFLALHGAKRDPVSHRDFILGLHRQFDQIGAFPSGNANEPDPCALAFLIGYPRSGTTLVENILASLPGVHASEERPTLRMADQAFLAGDAGLSRLATTAESDLEPFRQAFWEQARLHGARDGARLFVDMDPLKGIKLPLIARLFPRAKIIVMRRDPRDVVWSCFRTSFAPSAVAFEFAVLETAARHYDALMAFQEACLERLPLDRFELRYDALVRDFDRTTQDLCAFLEIDWNEGVRDFAATSQRRGVATASAAQVRKQLYDGTQQWRRYAAFMAPVLPVLVPWVERFGFEP